VVEEVAELVLVEVEQEVIEHLFQVEQKYLQVVQFL
jgi:hypothetical protein